MKANNCAIVILYKGQVAGSQVLQEIKDSLVGNGLTIPELLTMTVMDNNAIEEALVKDTVMEQNVVTTPSEVLKNAVVYIGERYKEYLNTPHLTMFAIRLSQDVKAEQFIEGDRVLSTAVEVIATTQENIPAKYVREYGFNPAVVNIVKRVYNPY